jgi:ATP-dependent exoDNAse (exonuclease V) beta subunit
VSTSVSEATGERRPTPEQEAAIHASGRRVLIEAGAGSGKTGVMVDRYCRLVCDEEVQPDAVLAITFTEKAAAELRQRVRIELTRRAAGGSAQAQELLATFGGASITTIHGFCQRVLAAHPVAAGIDPHFSVLDPAEADRAARAAFDEALEQFVGAGDSAQEETVAAYGVEALREMIVGAHEELRSRGVRVPELPEPPATDPAAALQEAATVAAATLAELSEKNKARPLVERAVELLAGRGEEIGLDELAGLRSKSTAKGMAEYREAIDVALARVAEGGEGGVAYGHARELMRLFAASYEEAKARRRGLDFEDLQLLAAALLSQDAVGGSYRARFRHVMVDEFQDTNRLQLRLIEFLRGPETDIVVVGDLLQSIYGFRHAELDVFREQRAEIAADPTGQAIELSGNFRSRPEVIGAVNALGSALIDPYQPLTVGLPPEGPPPRDGAPAVELLLTQKSGWEDYDLEPAVDSNTKPHYLAEARAIAQRLRDLVDSGVERGEIVLLLRAFTHLGVYEDSLARAGLRPYVVGGRGYWSQQQVSDVCALLAVIANPLDDQALFGALASPACGVSPDTLWLLRAASGRSRHVWGAVEALAGGDAGGLEAPERLGDVGEKDTALATEFVRTIDDLRRLGTRVPLSELIDRVVKQTGYDLAILLKPAGEARFANVRKLMQIAADFEATEGRDLRGLLDYLAFREVTGDESEAATAAEDHDGVRIMSIHRAKGLEFPVVAVAHLDRNLTSGGRAPLLTFGRDGDPRVGMQLRRLGARSINLYSHQELCEEENERDAEEGLRLFHVAATRARERLILSGVVPKKPAGLRASTPVVERIVGTFEIDRERNSAVAIPAAAPRPGLAVALTESTMAVKINAPGTERAAELIAMRPAPVREAPGIAGPAPLLRPETPVVPSRPLSYTAISAYKECPYRFYLERVLGLPRSEHGPGVEGERSSREERTARGAAVHALLEWSQANGWAEPSAELALRHAEAAGLDANPSESPHNGHSDGLAGDLLEPVRQWLGSPLRGQIAAEATRIRAEVPLLLGIGDTVLRGSIDLLVEREGGPPLVVDYKTDRLAGADPADRAAHYKVQRSIYALAVAEALGTAEVEVAYVFLERQDEPAATLLGAADMAAARSSLEATIARIGKGDFPVAPPEERDWSLCRGCPALRGLCSGPAENT